MNNTNPHSPVLLSEALKCLNLRDKSIYIDGTFGAGGHSRAILEYFHKQNFNSTLVGIDQDSIVKKYATKLLEEFSNNFKFIQGQFSDMDSLVTSIGIEKVDGILLDVGISSMQMDDRSRSFSFNSDVKLDMRMGSQKITAWDVVNLKSEKELADILYNFGGEEKSRQVAREICKYRLGKKIDTGKELADIIRKIIPRYGQKIDTATKSFQAIRIVVNDELSQLQRALEVSKTLLNSDGRLVVISFHELEDRIVKQFLKKESGAELDKTFRDPYYGWSRGDKSETSFKIEKPHLIQPSDEEVKLNPRARSARMRWGIRL